MYTGLPTLGHHNFVRNRKPMDGGNVLPEGCTFFPVWSGLIIYADYLVLGPGIRCQ